MHQPDPVFPPLLTGHAVKSPERPLEYACRGAAEGSLGAGDLVWSRNTARADCAIVLEPEVPLSTALQMGVLAQVALADCLGSLLPPVVPVHHRWPGTLLINGAAAGEVKLVAPTLDADAVPDWLVVGMTLQLVFDDPHKEPGEMPHQTALSEEGGAEISRTDILQTFSAYFLSWLNTWQDDGFRPICNVWMQRAEGDGKAMIVTLDNTEQTVQVLGLDDEGSIVIKPGSGPTQVLPLRNHIIGYGQEPAR